MEEKNKELAEKVKSIVEKKKIKTIFDNFAKDFFTGSGILIIIILCSIFIMLLIFSLPAFKEISIVDFLFSAEWKPETSLNPKGSYGILAMIVSTFLAAIGALIIAVPLGISISIYLAEIAPMWLREIFKPIIEILASIPSVIIGFIGLVVFSPIIADIFDVSNGLNALNASFCLAIMALPTIISLSEDAIKNVPLNYREASYALGTTKWETIHRIILPAAKSGIYAAIMLGMGRALGETMTVLMVAGNTPAMPSSFLSGILPMTATIAKEMGDVVIGSSHYHALFVIALVLFIITFIINIIADFNINKKRLK